MSDFTPQELWLQTCDVLKHSMSPAAFNTWIITNSLSEFRAIEPNRAIGVITSPTAFHSTNVEKNFYAQIKEVLDTISGRNTELQFRVGSPATPSTPTPPAPTTFSPPTTIPSPLTTTHSPTTDVLGPSISAVQERLREYAKTQQQRPQKSPPTPPTTQLFSESTIQSMTVDRARVQAQRAGLRLDYTFETFAVSSTNEMAHAAAQAVSSQPGTAYNPLFIYGGVGVGKTHLMHAVGNNILNNTPDSKVLYCTGEDFTNEIVSAIQNKKGIQFKEKFRNVDILLIDDVQFIAGKNTIQEEFFHTFNSITKRAGQIILTSDRPPSEISLLEDRLRSRFEAGLMVDIQQPSFELRTAILLIKAAASSMSIPMELAQVIASRVDSARKIEGIIKSIRSEVELKHREITAELIDDVCKVESERPVEHLRIKPIDLIKTVSEYFHLKPLTVRGQLRVKSIVRARHIAMYFMKEELNIPYVEIGYWFSNRDHTSAMHGANKIKEALATDHELQAEVSSLRTELSKISR